MSISITIIALICSAGGMTHPQLQPGVLQGPDDPPGLTDSELKRVRDRLPCLKPGMARKEVFDALGVDLPKRAYAQWGSGPLDDYRRVYQMAPAPNENGYNLIVVSDKESKFKRAQIACWEGSNKCAEDNKEAESKGCPEEGKHPDS